MMLSSLKLAAVSVIAVVTVSGALESWAGEPRAQDDKKSEKPAADKEAILGTWKVVGVEEDGKDASDTDAGREHKGLMVTITSEKFVVKKEDENREFTYHLDPDAKPKTIDLDDEKAKVLNCVYSLEGDTLKICGPRKSGEKRPAEVGTKEGSESFLLELKRETKEKTKNG
jgi:uncharacterized protein (TIGR03067 family)